jgi:hypothetical protein
MRGRVIGLGLVAALATAAVVVTFLPLGLNPARELALEPCRQAPAITPTAAGQVEHCEPADVSPGTSGASVPTQTTVTIPGAADEIRRIEKPDYCPAPLKPPGATKWARFLPPGRGAGEPDLYPIELEPPNIAHGWPSLQSDEAIKERIRLEHRERFRQEQRDRQR